MLRVFAKNEAELSILAKLYEEDSSLDFWTHPAMNRGTDIMTDSGKLMEISKLFDSKKMMHNVFINDVGRYRNQLKTNPKLKLTVMNQNYFYVIELLLNNE